MDATHSDSLNVPGASLYYEVRGSGPVLLMISGGPTDGDIFTAVADVLADRYTVVTFDTRGNSRSLLHAEAAEQSIEVEAEDAHQLLAALTQEPAYVFGNSSGAMVGLELLRRYPEQVRLLVAHEPPLTELLSDAASHRSRFQDIYETYQRDGVAAGMMKFMGNAGLERPTTADDHPFTPPPPAVDVELPEAESMARFLGNAKHFLAHRIRNIGNYVPDVAALLDARDRIVVAIGVETHIEALTASAAVLAERLDTRVVALPGDHGGFITRPQEFADMLDSTLQKEAVTGRAA